MEEIWKPVLGFEGHYEVSNLGRVRSLDRIATGPSGRQRRRRGQMLRDVIDRHGYSLVGVNNELGKHLVRVHRLVAEAFCDHPEGCQVVNHKDGNKQNNVSENLEWTTVQGNTQHSFDTGLQLGRKGESHHMGRLTEDGVREIIKRLSAGDLHADIANDFGVSFSLIGRIKNGKRWGHVRVPEAGEPPYRPQ